MIAPLQLHLYAAILYQFQFVNVECRLPGFLLLLPCTQMDFEYCYESDDADYEMSPLSDS